MPKKKGKEEEIQLESICEQKRPLINGANDAIDPQEKIASRYDRIVYWLQRRSISRSVLLSLFLVQRDLFTEEEAQKITLNLRLHLWLQGHAFPLENQRAITCAIGVDGFLRGADHFVQKWWTPTFLTLFLHDIIHYFGDSENFLAILLEKF